MYHVTFEFLRRKWLQHPDDGARAAKHVRVTNTVCVVLTCIWLYNKDTKSNVSK
jgi:hypothetical protein